MFEHVSFLYDAIYHKKDYLHEAKQIMALFESYGISSGDMLEVACGTGGHLQYLQKFNCTAFDLDLNMVTQAQHKNPDATVLQANMIDFELHAKFDAIVCSFSSIGYVQTLPNLQRTCQQFAKHLKPSGVLLLEPWYTPETFRSGLNHLHTAETPEVKIARMSSTAKEENLSILKFDYLIAQNGTVQHMQEEHRLGLFTEHETLNALQQAGFTVRFEPEGFIGRGLYLAQRDA